MAIQFSNNAATKLATNLAVDATNIKVTTADLSKFPLLINDTDYFMATITSAKPTGKAEVVKVIGVDLITGDLDIIRGQEGTQAFAFVTGDRFEHRLTAGSIYTIMKTGGGTFSPNSLYYGNIFYGG